MPYQYPSQADVQAYGRNLQSLPGAVRTVNIPSSNMTAPPASSKPKVRYVNGQWQEIRILGADNPQVYFAPQQPLQPVAQPWDYAVVGRPWDYPVGYNTWVTPRNGLAIGFKTLRALAEGYDVLRIMLERVKDKVTQKQWAILPKDKMAEKDDRCRMIEEFLQSPDKMNTWQDWLRMLLDQVLVYDAPSLYVRRTFSNKLYSMEVLDGSMFAPKVMGDGRLPPPDVGPAYQQVLKEGLPAADYIMPVSFGQPIPLDPTGQPFPELLYKPKYPRVDSPYGYSPVEQMITTINIALMREAYLANYYTSGSTPDLVFACPEDWTSTQIAQFKVWWDSVLAGNLANRRGTMFVPGGAVPFDTKEKALTDQTDEWLTRIMCFCLGLNPMPFIKQMNKGQEKTHHDEAADEGLGPWLGYVTDLFRVVIPKMWGWNDLEFRWEEDDSTDPTDQANIDQILTQAKIYHPDEIRAKRGDQPMEEGMRNQMDMATFSSTANSTILPDEQQAAKDDAAKELAASKPAPMIAPPSKPAEKSETHNHITMPKIELPKIELPAINITSPDIKIDSPVTIEKGAFVMPEMKAADVFVDVGATNVKIGDPTRKDEKAETVVTTERDADGNLVGKIWRGTTKTVKGERVNGKLTAKVED